MSLRTRITLIATAAVAVVLMLGALVFLLVLRDALLGGVRSVATAEATAIADRIDDGTPALTDAERGARDRIVQLVQGGAVIDGSSDDDEDDDGSRPLLTGPGQATITIDAKPYLVVGDSVDSTLVVVARELTSVDDSYAATTPLVVLALPVLVLLLGATVWVVTGRALRPVDRMRAEVDEVTAQRLDRRVAGADRGDELGRLAATMNRMLDRLDGAARTQRRFVSDASHELRSPLASLRQYAAVAEAYPDRMTAAELAAAIRDEGGRLEGIVAGMLVLARADEGSLHRRDEPVDLDDLVLPEVQRLRATTALTVDASVAPARIRGDAELLAQVVRNLADNAARHARSAIAITLTEDAVLTVADDGDGVPEADRERVFERFVRLDEARARDAGGSGLGLAIVREIVQAHGGTVQLDAAAGGGARFVVRFR